MYPSNDWKPRILPDQLHRWVKLHAEQQTFLQLHDVDHYYQEFSAQATPLIAASRLTDNKVNLLFYRGIPSNMRKKIKHKIPTAQQTATTALTITSVIGYLRDQFDEDNINNDNEDMELSFTSEDGLTSGSEDEEFTIKASWKQRRKVKFTTKQVPGAAPVPPPEPTAIDTLARQMEDLWLGQATLLREVSQVRALSGGSQVNMPPQGNRFMGEHRCFICDQLNYHRLGVHNCPDVQLLINKGLTQFMPSGRLMHADRSDLPQALYGGGGITKALHDEQQSSKDLKGKARET